MKNKELKPPLKGSCHCGVIKFQMNISLKDLRRCNCSICSRKGFVMGSAPVDVLTIISGKKYLSTYKWNNNITTKTLYKKKTKYSNRLDNLINKKEQKETLK